MAALSKGGSLCGTCQHMPTECDVVSQSGRAGRSIGIEKRNDA